MCVKLLCIQDIWQFCISVFSLFLGNFDLEGFENCIRSINSGVRSLFLEIRKGVSEDDGTYYYGLVCNE